MSSKIVNKLDNCDDPLVVIHRRNGYERGAWEGAFFREAEAHGDGDIALRYLSEGLYKYHGLPHGKLLRSKMKSDPVDLNEFSLVFGEGTYRAKTQMVDHVKRGPECLELHFHGCPLLQAWQDMGFDDNDCHRLCRATMSADLGTAEGVGIKYYLQQTLAGGAEYCRGLMYRGELDAL